MRTIQRPGVFLAQFLADDHPFNELDSLADYMAGLGYEDLQLPIWNARVIGIQLAA